MRLGPQSPQSNAARTTRLAALVANMLPTMLPALMVSCIAPKARPRCSGRYRSAIRDCAQGMTSARPRPFTVVKSAAAGRVVADEKPTWKHKE